MLSNVFKLIYINNLVPPLNYIFYIILICSLKINNFFITIICYRTRFKFKKI
jgi:hypothetical protein